MSTRIALNMSPAPREVPPPEVYRPFFTAAIVCMLTAGCGLGAIALLGIARQHSYTANVWTPYVLAHANSQLFGWCALFIMGFTLQHHQPRDDRKDAFRRLSAFALWGTLLAVALRFVAEPLAALRPEVGVPLGVGSALVQLVAVGAFVGNTLFTRRRTPGWAKWTTKFIVASVLWLSIVALAEPRVFALSHQADRQASILFVSEWFPPYREAQFLGFVGLMVFGVAFTKFPECFEFQPSHRAAAEAGFFVWNAALLLRTVGWVAGFRSDFSPATVKLYQLGGAGLAFAAVLLVVGLRVFERFTSPISAHKFLRAAFGWLLFAGVLILLEPWHLMRIGESFSHAYSGAIRHAVTVGFLSQTIVGVGLTVAHRRAGISDAKTPALWSVFLLLNLGNGGRVVLEVLSDTRAWAFEPMGFTGFVELAALAIWAWVVLCTMWRRGGRPGVA